MPKEPEKPKKRGETEGEVVPEATAPGLATPVRAEKDKAAGEALREAEQGAWDPDAYIAGLTAYQYDNARWDAYGRTIRALEGAASFSEHGEQYAENWKDLLHDKHNETIKKYLLERLRNTTMIDLGGGYTIGEAGTSAPSVMQEVAQELGVSTYINVDRYLRGRRKVRYTPQNVTEEIGITQPERMRVIYVEDDMLRFLARMRSETPNITLTLNGIDAFLIPRRTPGLGTNYHEMVAQEIARVLPQGGVVMTCGSEDATKYFEELGFELAEGFDREGTAPPQMWVKK